MTYKDQITPNKRPGAASSYPGIISRLDTRSTKKDLLGLDVCINDSSDYSLYYFNIITKPLELKLGGNIFEFAPPRNRFVINSQILFEAIDANGNPLPYEILPQKVGSQSIRMCIAVDGDTPQGPGAISLVGEALLDECGCPLPEDCQDRFNVRWSNVIQVKNDDISGTIEYDTAPTVTISETQIPWTYQTYEDVYDINPGTPGEPYTVSGSYTPTYNSQPTGSKTGRVDYNLLVAPDTQSLGTGKITALSSTDLRFSASMVGGYIYVSGGLAHIDNLVQPIYPKRNRYRAPAFYATISAIINSTEAEVTPAYMVKANNPGGDIQDYPATSFHTDNGLQLTWNETSASISYTDPTAETSTLSRVEKTVEQHVSYADITINNLRPLCGVATDVEVYVKSNRVEGSLTKLTEFPIEPSSINIDDSRSTEKGNSQAFLDFGLFDNQNVINTYWEAGTNVTILGEEQITVTKNDTYLLNACEIDSNVSAINNDRSTFITFNQKPAYLKTLSSNSNYFIEFDAHAGVTTPGSPAAEIDIYISGSGVEPTNKTNQDEKELGKYVGSIVGKPGASPLGQTFIGNSFECKNIVKGISKPIFVIRTGVWSLANIKVTSGPGSPIDTGITPNTIRTLIPMPPITRFNDQYLFELRYKNKNGSAKKVSRFENAQFQGNDASAFLASQPGNDVLHPWFNGLTALTSSKNVLITGSLFVSERIFANEFHTNIVTSSIIFQEGDTIFGNSADDTHFFEGDITASNNISASGDLIANNATVHEGFVTVDGSSTSHGFELKRDNFDTYKIRHLDGGLTIQNSTDSRKEMTFDGAGNVGIGATNPSQKLHVDGHALISAEKYYYVAGTGGGFGSDASGNFKIRQNDADLIFGSGNNVGIGISSPGEKLEIVGNVSASGILYGNQAIITGPISGSFVSASTSIYSGGHITASGNISASGTIYASKFQSAGAANETILFNDNLDITGHVTASGNISASGTITAGTRITIHTPAASNNGQGLVLNRPAAGTHYHAVEFATDGTVDWSLGQNQVDAFEIWENGADSSTRFTILEGGNVGIGTTSPLQKLHINGHILIENNNELRWKDSGGNQRTILELTNADDLYFGGSFAGSLIFVGGGSYTERMRIADDGNVGIGTASPLGLLQIDDYTVASQGNNTSHGVASIFANSGTDALYLGVKNSAYPNRGYGFKVTEAGVNANFTIFEKGLNGDRLTITTGGNVGIGTTSPNNKLQVNYAPVAIASLTATSGTASTNWNRNAGLMITGASVSNALALGASGTANDRKAWIQVGHPDTAANSLGGLALNPLGGNVGIGTTSPDNKLMIESTSDSMLRLTRTGVRSWRQNIGSTGNFIIRDLSGTPADRLTINTAGNVGIGTTTPTEKLHVVGNITGSSISASTQVYSYNDIYAGSHITASGNISSSGGTVTAKQLTLDHASRVDIKFSNTGDEDHYIRKDGDFLRFRGHDDSTVLFELKNNSNGSNVSSFPNGSVGIGTNSPSKTLDVNGDVIADTYFVGNTSNYIDVATGLRLRSDANGIRFTPNGTDRMVILANGNVGIGTTAPGELLEVKGNLKISPTNGGNLQFRNNTTPVALLGSTYHINSGTKTDFNAYVYGNNSFGVWTNNNNRLTILGDGNVGIGTTTPTDLLDVGGAIRVTSNVGFNSGKAGRIYKASNHGLAIHSVAGSENDFAMFTPAGQLKIVVPTGTQNVILNRDSGNVGIGTATPVHKLAVEGTTKLGNNVANKHDITGSIHMNHTNMSIFSGSGRFAFGVAKPGTLAFDNSSVRRLQIYDGDQSAVQLNVTNWETASAYIAGGGVVGGNTLAARGPRASLSVNVLNSSASYGYGGTRGLAGGSFSYLSDTFEGNTNTTDIGDGGDRDSEGHRLLQEVLLISTGGNPQGSINLHARGNNGQQIRFFTGGDDARNEDARDKTLETQRMVILHDGEVGIGTKNPARRLHVSNSIAHNSDPIVRFETLPTAPDNANIVMVDSNGDLYQTAKFNTVDGTTTISSSLLVEGNITGSGNIWISGSDNLGNFISASNLISSGHITASGDISASGDIRGYDLILHRDVTVGRSIIVAGDIDLEGSIDVNGTTNLDIVDIDGAVDMASTLTLTGNADFNGQLDVSGTTNLDIVDIDGAVDMATTLTLAGNADFNGDLDVSGTTNLDVVDIDGAVNIAQTALITGVLTTTAEQVSNGGITFATNKKIEFRDDALFINSSTDGQLDIVADDEIQIAATAIDINGNVDISGTLALGGATTLATNTKLFFRDDAIHISSTADGDLSIAANDEIDITSTLIDINGNVTISGTTGAAAVTTSTIVASGIIKTDSTTAATTVDDGSLQTDGGLSVKLDAVIGDDLIMISDGAVIHFGADKDTSLTHTDGTGLTLNSTNKLCFGDTGTYINQSTDGQLDLVADTEIQIAATTVDINGNVDISGNLTVAGTTTTENTTIIESTVTVLQFEGANDNAHETQLKVVEPSADTTFSLPALSAGNYFIPAIIGTATDASAAVTAAEFALLDGGSTIGTTAVNDNDGIVSNDGGVMKHTKVQTYQTYFDANSVGGEGIVTTGALSAGTIAAGFGAIDNGTSGIRTNTFTAETAFVPDASDGASLGTASLEFSDLYLADGANIYFGDNQKILLTDATYGLTLTNAHTADAKPTIFTIASSEAGVVDGEILTAIEFKAGDSDGSDGASVVAAIAIKARETFSSTASSTDMEFACSNGDVSTGLASTYAAGAASATPDMILRGSDSSLQIAGPVIAGGIIKTDDTTDATSTTDGSLQTDGGLSVTLDAIIGDDLSLLSDAAVLGFGANKDVTLTHVHNTGLLLNSTMAIQFNDASQFIHAPSNAILDINATDEIELNATLVDVNANIDVEGTYQGGGTMTTGGNIVIPDAGNIGSASDTDAIAIASDGVVTFSQKAVIDSGIDVNNFNLDGTTLALSSGNMTIAAAGGTIILDAETDIILDANGADIIFKDDGTEFGRFRSSNGFVIRAAVSDKDMIFQGNDGGSTITALTLDMSAAGAATFNGAITGGGLLTTGGNIVIPDAGNIGSASDTDAIAIASDGVVTFSQNVVVTGGTLSLGNDVTIFDDGTNIIRTDDTLHANANIHVGGDGKIFDRANTDNFIELANNLDINASGDIILDADGAEVIFKDGGTSIGHVSMASQDLTIKSIVNNKDIIFKGVSGDSTPEALKLDMSDGGTAIFSHNILLPASAELSFSSGDVKFVHSSNTLTFSGGTLATAALTTTTIVASGIIKTDDTTNATSTTDGSLQTDGGLSVALDAIIGDDLSLLSDAAVLGFGADKDVTLTHVHDTGLLLNGAMKLQFRDANTFIHSNAANDIIIAGTDVKTVATNILLDAGTLIDLQQDTAVTGDLTVSGKLVMGSTDALTDAGLLSVGAQTGITATANLVTVGALNAGSITSGFTSIDVGSGAIAAGSFDASDGNITNVGDIDADSISVADAGVGLNIDFSGGNTAKSAITIRDNIAEALVIQQGGNDYLKIVTTNSGEALLLGHSVSGTTITIGHATSEVEIGDNITIAGDATVAGKLVMGSTDALTNAGLLSVANQSNITGLGTISSGVWNGDKIADAYLSDNTLHLDTAQTISAVKTIGTNVKLEFRDSNTFIHSNDANDLTIAGTDVEIAATNIILDAATSIALEGNTTVTGNLSITGTMNIDGDTTIVDSTTVAIADGMMKLAKDQANNADAIDFGFYGQYGVGGTHTFAGIYRDLSVSGDPFVFFDSLTTEPTTTVAQNGGFDLADIMAGTITAGDGFTGDLTGTSSLIEVTDSNSDIDFPIVFHDESSALLDDTGVFEYNPRGGILNVPIVRVHTSLVPNADDGATIGSANLNFSDLFLADEAVLNFGDDQDVKLTHVADTGLLLNSTMKILFNDASQFIHGASNAILAIGATDEIDLTATLVDMNANLDLDGTADISGLLTVQTGIVPNAQDGGYLGTTSLQWSDLFMADGAVIGFGDNNEVTLTHVHDTGLLLNEAMAIQFRDDAISIGSTTDGQLDIVADTEIQIVATTIDINGNLDVSGTTVSAGKITADAGIDIDNFNIDGTTIALSSGTMVLDSAADIILDPAGNDVLFRPGGTEVGAISNASSDLVIRSIVNNKDIKFSGVSGDSAPVALRLDMSDGGTAVFGHNIKMPSAGVIDFNGGDMTITHGSNILTFAGGTVATAALTTTTIVASGIIKTDDTTNATSTTNGSLQTDGGLSVAIDAVIGDNLSLLSDSSVLALGADKDATLTHDGTTGLTIAAAPISINSTGDLTLDSTTDIVLDAAGGNIEFKDAGTLQLTLDMDTTDGAQVIQLGVDGDNLIFKQYDGTTVLTLDDDTTVTAAAAFTAGGIITGTGFTAGSAILTEAELEKLDGITNGAGAANKALVLDGDADIASGVRNITIDGELDAATGDFSGIIDVAGVATLASAVVTAGATFGGGTGASGVTISTAGAITADAIIKTESTTNATSTTDGSLQTDGGLSVAMDAVIGDDLSLLSDAAVLGFGANKDVTLTHVHNTGLLLNDAMEIQFRDSAISIGSANDGDMMIAANDEIDITSTLIDINGNVDISGTLSGNFVVRSTNNANTDGANFNVNTTNKSVNEYAYEVQRSGTTVAGVTIGGKVVGSSLDINGAADIAGALVVSAGALSITGDGSNAVTFTESSAGIMTIAAPDDIILDANSDIILDANGADIRLKDSGSEFAKFTNSSNDFHVACSTQDKDILFRGMDGNTTLFTALTLDMSDAGTAIFNHDIRLADNGAIKLGTGNDLQVFHDGSHSYIQNGTGDLYIQSNANDKDLVLQCDNGDGGTTAYITLDGSAGHTTVQKNMVFADSVSSRFGTGGDLAIFHDGSQGYISLEGTGDLYIRNTTDDKDIIFQSDNGSGGVATYLTIDGGAGSVEIAKPLNIAGNTTIVGALRATTKSFVIDTPEGGTLEYGSLEGRSHDVFYKGKCNDNIIELPKEWEWLIDEATITVQLTSIGKHQNLYVKEIKNNKVYISAGIFKTPNCFFIIHASRKDTKQIEHDS